MDEKINYLIGKEQLRFSCGDSMVSFGSKILFVEGDTEQGLNNSNNGSKGSIAIKEILKQRRGQLLPSKSDETELKQHNNGKGQHGDMWHNDDEQHDYAAN